MVIVTHNMHQAARVADHTAFFYLGKLIEFGSTEQIFEKTPPPHRPKPMSRGGSGDAGGLHLPYTALIVHFACGD